MSGSAASVGCRLRAWGLLPERTDPQPVVLEWPQFMQGCIRYRQSLDEQAANAPLVNTVSPGS